MNFQTFLDESRFIAYNSDQFKRVDNETDILRREAEVLKRRVNDLQTIVSSKTPTIVRANGADSLARSYKWIINRRDVLEAYLKVNKNTTRKQDYTTYPLKMEEYQYFLECVQIFEHRFAPHMPAIKHILAHPIISHGKKRKATDTEQKTLVKPKITPDSVPVKFYPSTPQQK